MHTNVINSCAVIDSGFDSGLQLMWEEGRGWLKSLQIKNELLA